MDEEIYYLLAILVVPTCIYHMNTDIYLYAWAHKSFRPVPILLSKAGLMVTKFTNACTQEERLNLLFLLNHNKTQ